jgi:hypothetical protein
MPDARHDAMMRPVSSVELMTESRSRSRRREDLRRRDERPHPLRETATWMSRMTRMTRSAAAPRSRGHQPR